jgi:diguanylate cyclase (GGDEF)-like protein/PAS domain S-box-containing protein
VTTTGAMSLHTPTLFIVMIAATAVMGTAMAFIAYGAHRDLRAWAIAMGLQSVAYVLIGLRGEIPYLASVVLANALVSASLATFLEGLLRFQGRSGPRWLIWLPVGIILVSFPALSNAFAQRVFIGSTVFLAQTLAIMYLLLQRRRATAGRGQYILCAGAAVASLVLMARLVALATGMVQTQSLTEPNLVQAGTYLTSLLGTILLTIGILTMIQERADRALRDSERHYRQLVEAANEGICVIQAGLVRFVNPRIQQMLGYPGRELIGQDFLQYVHVDDRDRARETHQRRLRGDGDDLRVELRVVTRSAQTVWLEVSGRRVDWQGAVATLNFVTDITERRLKDEQIRDLAYKDSLTKLPNRRLFLEHLQRAQAANKRHAHHAAVIYLDLDNFKPLNDTHGHHVGDLLLIEVARRIRQALREADTVARFGGDEFVVLLNDLSDAREQAVEQVRRIADKLVAALSKPYRLTAHLAGAVTEVEHRCSASMGIALIGAKEVPADRLLDQADAAMYQAKHAGRNRYEFATEPASA